MRFLFVFLCLFVFAFAELREVEVSQKGEELFDIGNGIVVQTDGCYHTAMYNTGYGDGYDGKGYYDAEGGQLILAKNTCKVIKIFNKGE